MSFGTAARPGFARIGDTPRGACLVATDAATIARMVSARRPLGRPATRADLESLPGNVKGEIIDGELFVQPRPRPRHSAAAARLHVGLARGAGPEDLDPPGWIILIEPGIELADAPEIAPDLAGWKRERLEGADLDLPISVVPDWICEVLSPSNRAYDRTVKLPFYARIGVGHVWLVDPPGRTIEIKRLEEGRWIDLGAFGEDALMRAPPFEGVPIALAPLWRW